MVAVLTLTAYFLYEEKLGYAGFQKAIAITCGLLVCPVLFLHLEYLINDYKLNVEIIPEKKEITISRKNTHRIVKFDAISELNLFGETKDFNNLPFQNYRYYRVKLQDNTSFTISCFSARRLEEIFRGVPFRTTRRLYASMLFENTR
ncbi:MAG: hypothetical protein K0S09_2490 [Sphingobacteriaceae bacterium]|nr:hypothetical protein [Sphingobacteriaceae bacterium]